MNNKSIELAHAVEEWAKADACVAENGWEATFNGVPVECVWDKAKTKMTALAKEVRNMNNRNQITGMIAVHDDAALNARLDYAIDTSTNRATYTIACHWKLRHIYGKCPFDNYADARLIFDGLPAVAEQELKATA